MSSNEKDNRELRVFVGLTEVAGVNAGLAYGFRKLGHKVTSVVLNDHQFEYPKGADSHRVGLRLSTFARRKLGKSSSSGGRRYLFALTDRAGRIFSTPGLLLRNDVFIMLYGTCLLGPWEGRIFRLLGKKYIQVFLGSDARPAFLDGYHVNDNALGEPDLLKRQCARQRAKVGALSNAASFVVALPGYAHYIERKYLDLLWMGLPILPAASGNDPIPSDHVFTIVHAPSHPTAKGSSEIRAVVHAFCKTHPDVRFEELVGLKNSDLRTRLRSADVVIDQLYSDTPSPALVTEAASQAIPAILGTLHEELLDRREDPDFPHSILIRPDELRSALDGAYSDRRALSGKGRAAQQFVQQMWAPEQVARRLLLALSDDASVPWRMPGDVSHGGAGLSPTNLAQVESILAARGWKSLLERRGP